MPLVQQPFAVELLQRPPLALDILIVVSYVGVVHIHPITEAVAHLFPLALVLPYGLLALLYKRLYAVTFDLRLAVYAQKFFNFQLYGQTVRIPARLS